MNFIQLVGYTETNLVPVMLETERYHKLAGETPKIHAYLALIGPCPLPGASRGYSNNQQIRNSVTGSTQPEQLPKK
jgi:hypothetical protein